jgi:hypothetical protein
MPKQTGKEASVDIEDNVPILPQRSEEMLAAEHEGSRVQSQETIRSEDGDVMATHTRPGTLVMYKPTETQGYVPRTVSVSAIRLLLKQGWKEVCPDCGARHINARGEESTDPNLCSAREPVAVRLCRVCPKRIYDNQGLRFDGKMASDDPNVIMDDDFDLSTPAERTKASLNLHYWIRHPRQAQQMGLPPLPAALRDMVEGAQKVQGVE